MKRFDMKKARRTLRNAVQGVDPFAVEYIDWDQFELELEAVIEGEGPREAVLAVFSIAVNRARQLRAQDRTIIKPN